MLSGQLTVPNAGTPQQFPQYAAPRVRITALRSNTGIVVVGSAPGIRLPGTPFPTSGPVASSNSAVEGDALQPGESIVYGPGDMGLLWLDAAVDGEGVSFFEAPFLHGTGGARLEGRSWFSTTPTEIANVYNTVSTETKTSAAIVIAGFRHHTFSCNLAKATTPTDIVISLLVNDGDGNYQKLQDGYWGDVRFDDTAIGTAGLPVTLRYELAAYAVKYECVGTTTNASWTITLSSPQHFSMA